MKHDTSAAGQHAEPDRKLVVPPSVRWEKYSVTTRSSNMAGKCCNGVRWKQSTQNFERHLFSHTAKQRRLILAKRWRPKKYVHFTVCERARFVGLTLLILQTDKSTRSSARKCWSRFTTPA